MKIRLATPAFLAAVLLFLFFAAMGRNLNHDEHQFIAPAAVLIEGAQPYRDFPLFHLPNLVFLYAGLFRVFDHPLLTARCFSVLCAFATAVLIFREGWKFSSLTETHWRFAAAAAPVLLFIFDPLCLFTTGRAWNHDSTALLIVLAVILQISAAHRNSLLCAATSAICAGLAVGTRLTCAPILIPLWISNWFLPAPIIRRTGFAAIYFLAATAALAPSLYYLCAHTDSFLFSNFEFPRLRLLDPENERIRKTMNPLRKLRFFFKEVALPSLPLFLTFLVLGIGRPTKSTFATTMVLAILPFALLGCFAPSRYQYQHYFIIIPLLVLGVVYGISAAPRPANWLLIALTLSVVTCLSSFIYVSYTDIFPGPFSDWFPTRIASIGTKIRAQNPRGPVLTLAPIYPLEARLQTYPEFATGPFAWKSARFVAPERRVRLHLIAPDDLESLLAAKPPGAILTGVEETALEKPLVEYSRAHQFTPVNLGKERTLWLPPAH